MDRVRLYLKKIKSAEAKIKEEARKHEVRERHDLKPNAAIAFVDTTVAKRTIERTLGIKRKKTQPGHGETTDGKVVIPKKKQKRTTKNTSKKKKQKR